MKPVHNEGAITPEIRLSVMESQAALGNDVTIQTWFIRDGVTITRSELYLFENGSVVAYQDCVNGVNGPLYMDTMFKSLYEGEPAFDTILHYAGVTDVNKIQLYYTGR